MVFVSATVTVVPGRARLEHERHRHAHAVDCYLNRERDRLGLVIVGHSDTESNRDGGRKIGFLFAKKKRFLFRSIPETRDYGDTH